jgi:hypothetical protein
LKKRLIVKEIKDRLDKVPVKTIGTSRDALPGSMAKEVKVDFKSHVENKWEAQRKLERVVRQLILAWRVEWQYEMIERIRSALLRRCCGVWCNMSNMLKKS